MDVTRRLAQFSAELTYERVPEALQKECRFFVLDAIGVMLGAAGFARENKDLRLARYLQSVAAEGPATIVGHGVHTTPMMAAFGNGTLSEVLDCQDTNLWVRSHNGTPVIPTILALSEQREIPWREAVPAIAAGYEVHTRLLLGVQPGHWYKGFQGTGTFGSCGAAVAAGRLLGLEPDRMSAALGVAGFIMPVSNGDNQFKGHNIKPVHGGQAAMAGLSSALLAEAGFQAGPLEGEPPRYHAALHILSDGPDLDRCISGLGEVWHTRQVAFKPFPIGHLIIGAVEATLELRKHRFDPLKVKGIRVTTFEDAVTFTGKKYTSTQSNHVDAHLSIPYCVAVALLDGKLTPEQISERRLRDADVHDLAARVVAEDDPAMTAMFPTQWPVEVQIDLQDGSTLRHRIDDVMWSPQRLPTWDELSAKFHVMADGVIGKDCAQQAIDLIADLKPTDTLRPVMKLVAGKPHL